MKKLYFSFIVLFAITWTQVVAQTTYYVKTSADGGVAGNDGLSWATAKTLAAAITAASGANGDMIFVKKGTYTATASSALITLNGTHSGLKFYGGFSGTESSPAERVFGTTAADSTNLVGNNNRVVYNNATLASPITSLVYDGFTITNGFATGSGVGGGMANLYASLTITNCIFKGNSTNNGSGGGMYNSNNTVTVTNCKFYNNSCAANGGGGIIASTGSNANITNCTFDSNAATHATSGTGGGVSTYSDATPTTVTITDCTFTRNTGGSRGGAVFNSQNVTTTISGCTLSDNTATTGAGMYNNTSAAPTVTNCMFTDNSTTTGSGGGMFNNTSASPTISGCTFSGNTSATGGGIYNNTSASPTITNCMFKGNSTTTNGGGGIYNYTSASPTVTYCTFAGNVANAGGGGVVNYANATYVNCLFSGNKGTTGGGVFNADGAKPNFKNCTIAGNSATSNGGGIYSTGSGAIPVITNCIIYGNSNGIFNSTSASATVTYSDVQYVASDGDTDYSSGTGNLNLDPLFTTSPLYSTAPFTIGGDYTLQSTSPVINAGSNSAISGYTTDLLGNTRIYNDVTVDMGAYEYQGVLPVKLISFGANYRNQQVILSWKTSSENNNSHFEVLRSDGSGFKVIGSVKGNGNSQQEQTYRYTDVRPLAGLSYYQLRQVDFNGNTELSEVVPVKIALTTNGLSVTASADKQQVKLLLNADKAGLANIAISNINGQKVAQSNKQVEKGLNNFSISAPLKKSVYIVVLTINGVQQTSKLLVE